MARRPEKVANAASKRAVVKKSATAKVASKKKAAPKIAPALRPDWPKCSWCPNPSVYKFHRKGKELHCCVRHTDKMEKNRGSNSAPALSAGTGLKKQVKIAKKKIVKKGK